jgi:hypothetical protein
MGTGCGPIGSLQAGFWEGAGCGVEWNVSPKRRHRSANPHGAKTQDLDNNVIIIAARTSNLNIDNVSILLLLLCENICRGFQV